MSGPIGWGTVSPAVLVGFGLTVVSANNACLHPQSGGPPVVVAVAIAVIAGLVSSGLIARHAFEWWVVRSKDPVNGTAICIDLWFPVWTENIDDKIVAKVRYIDVSVAGRLEYATKVNVDRSRRTQAMMIASVVSAAIVAIVAAWLVGGLR